MRQPVVAAHVRGTEADSQPRPRDESQAGESRWNGVSLAVAAMHDILERVKTR